MSRRDRPQIEQDATGGTAGVRILRRVIPRLEPDIVTYRRRDEHAPALGDRALRRAVEAGTIVRVAPGVYVRHEQWRTLSPIDRHALRVVEVVDRARSPLIVSHYAAAAIWGIDQLGNWPALVDVIVGRRGGGRSTGAFRRRTSIADDIQTVPWRGHQITTPAQTALDLARVGAFTDGVIAVDQATWLRRRGGALASLDEIATLHRESQTRSGDARARRAVSFASALSDSVRESQSRSLLAQLGFPSPVLQKRFELSPGRFAFADFWFPEHDHVGEFDGTGKYFDPRLLAGRTPQQALIEEKDRGDEMRRQVRALSRWRTPALDDPRALWDILTADGLPSKKPRPPRGLVLR